MSQSDPHITEPEAELTPDAERVIARARRVFGGSMLVLLLGFIAIGGALVYRAMRDDGAPVARYGLEAVALPDGAVLVSASAGEGLVTLTYRLGERTEIRIVDGGTGETVGQFTVETE